ncbi:hypothetical protein SPSIL_046630 [Sporomusa silvacetica DSM 10669]|uniref:Uncharacterized protein n=1 Tax=Sporomusa silvacetica DSM 10669 TaxID=1123289 RepID=A0ABZ3IRV4_9FIRM|nr:hypothetical protein [Sporomusa silvacetica]OZC23970.1 hypothetical protein SPSIL_00180 [Sporomusa silvacetica DSM 10669]
MKKLKVVIVRKAKGRSFCFLGEKTGYGDSVSSGFRNLITKDTITVPSLLGSSRLRELIPPNRLLFNLQGTV